MPVYRDKEHKTYYCKFGYKDWRGQYHQTTKREFKKSSEAKEYENSFKERLSGSNNMTMQNLYDLYKADIESRLKRTSALLRAELRSTFPYFRNVKVRDITPAAIRQWQNTVINQKRKTCDGKTLERKIEKINSLSLKHQKLAIHSYAYIRNRFYKYICAAGIKKIRLYDLQHSHISSLVHLGIPITAISKRIGHKTPKITLEISSYMYEEDGADIAALLEKSGHNQVKN